MEGVEWTYTDTGKLTAQQAQSVWSAAPWTGVNWFVFSALETLVLQLLSRVDAYRPAL
jgi:hypothetical protein